MLKKFSFTTPIEPFPLRNTASFGSGWIQVRLRACSGPAQGRSGTLTSAQDWLRTITLFGTPPECFRQDHEAGLQRPEVVFPLPHDAAQPAMRTDCTAYIDSCARSPLRAASYSPKFALHLRFCPFFSLIAFLSLWIL